MKKQRKKSRRLLPLLLLTLLIAFTIWQNLSFTVTRYDYTSPALPAGLDGLKIALVSDVHDISYGEDNSTLLTAIAKEEPDLIAITGDLISKDTTDLRPAIALSKGCTAIAPTYYVTGNHERRNPLCADLITELTALGVTVLDDTAAPFIYGDAKLSLWGLGSETQYQEMTEPEKDAITFTLNRQRVEGNERFRILLAHEPDYFSTYAKSGVDLILSGHTHGGQIRIPLLGAVVVSGQGFFPKYQYGIYKEGQSTMVVSKGLGNSVIPFRIFCQPELVIITLKAQ